ncbi:MAG TPA: DUF4157 domain-containing protein [Blastocatellia bacterium]|nr:DUF4157 domain-containing protein [Blastocatellia bacterium]
MDTKLAPRIRASQEHSNTPVQTTLLQRACSCGQHTTAGGECDGCDKKRLQRRSASEAGQTEVPPIVHDVLRSTGQPLDPATRMFMEPRFGNDFSKVRVHTDAKAAESAREVNALAYTVGRDVVFAAGQYTPGIIGRPLIAHELAHVVQQSVGETSDRSNLRMETDHGAEAEAEQAATFASRGEPILVRREIGAANVLARRSQLTPDDPLEIERSAVELQASAEKEHPKRLPKVQVFIDAALPACREVRRTFGVPISVCLTQGAWESGWNISNTHPFGESTKEGPPHFVTYTTFRDAAIGYGKNLKNNPAYSAAWKFENDPKKFLFAIGEPYCPKCDYANKLESGIRQPFAIYLYDE